MAASDLTDDDVLKQALADLEQKSEEDSGVVSGYVPPPRERAGEDIAAKRAAARLWLISFSDLFSLMLVFFVMLFSIKDPDMEKIGGLSGKYSQGAGAAEHKAFAGGENDELNISRIELGDGINLDYLEGVLKTSLAEVKLQGLVDVSQGYDYLRLTVSEERAFAGGDVMSSGGQIIAKGLAERLALLSNRVTVIAVPSDSAEWGSGIDQAKSFADAMREAGYRKPLTVLADGSGDGSGIEIRVEAHNGRVR